MAHAAVAPVQQCQSPAIAAEIAWMKVAVDQRVPESASVYIVEPVRKSAHKVRKHCAILRRDFVAAPLYDAGDRNTERRRSPIGQTECEQFLHAVAPQALKFHEPVHHFQQQRQFSGVQVLACDLGQQHATAVMTEQDRDLRASHKG
jgi:hypothetical protein